VPVFVDDWQQLDRNWPYGRSGNGSSGKPHFDKIPESPSPYAQVDGVIRPWAW
jgi:hypothetical protein